MSFDGNGNYTVPPGTAGVTATVIDSTKYNAFLTDLQVALSKGLLRDGQSAAQANVPMGGFRFTGLAAGSADGDSVRFEQLAAVTAAVQSQTATAFTASGTGTAYTLTPSPVITAYAAGQSWWITFPNLASGAAPTLAVNGITTPPNLVKQITAGTYQNIAAGEIPANHRSRCTMLSTTQILVETLPPAASTAPLPLAPQILTIPTPTLASNAMTIPALAFTLDFRSATLTSAAITTIIGTPAALVVPASATLGTISAVQSDIYLLALNNVGTIEYAVVNVSGGVNLSESGVISSTAISASATSASVVYSNSARTSVAYRVIGLLRSTQTTAGNWAQALSLLQGYGGQALASMSSAGYGQTWQSVTRVNGTTYYNTTGKLIFFMVQAVGVTFANNLPVITVNGVFAGAGSFSSATNNSTAFTVIPPGGSYSWTIAGGSASYVASELR